MIWKQFLKPDWRKITVFMIIFVINSILIFDYIGNIYCSYLNDLERGYTILIDFSKVAPTPPIWIGDWRYETVLRIIDFTGCDIGYGAIFDTFFLILSSKPEPPPIYVSLFQIGGFPFSIIMWYLISCLLIWIYDKFRKKKK